MSTRARRLFVVSIILLLVVGVFAYRQRVALFEAVFERIAERRLRAEPLAGLPDGLHVALCGAGSPLPDERRGAPCTLVIAGQRQFLLDAGSGAARGLARMGFNPADLEAVLLTHFHSDHIDGLGEVLLQRWAGGAAQAPLPIHGPDGVERIVAGLRELYAQDRDYRIAHHGERIVPPGGFGGVARPFGAFADVFARRVLIDEPDLQIVAFGVAHAPVHPAVGYRIRYRDRSVVVSGDTAKAVSVEREAKGADLLVHEALSPTLVATMQAAAARVGRSNVAQIFADIPSYHTTPEQAAEIARDAGVGALLLTHIVPGVPPLPGAEAAFLGAARTIFARELVLGRDGDLVSLPVGGKEIRFSRR